MKYALLEGSVHRTVSEDTALSSFSISPSHQHPILAESTLLRNSITFTMAFVLRRSLTLSAAIKQVPKSSTSAPIRAFHNTPFRRAPNASFGPKASLTATLARSRTSVQNAFRRHYMQQPYQVSRPDTGNLKQRLLYGMPIPSVEQSSSYFSRTPISNVTSRCWDLRRYFDRHQPALQPRDKRRWGHATLRTEVFERNILTHRSGNRHYWYCSTCIASKRMELQTHGLKSLGSHRHKLGRKYWDNVWDVCHKSRQVRSTVLVAVAITALICLRSYVQKYALWTAFNVAQAAILSPLMFLQPALLARAGLYTAGVMGSIAFVGATAKQDKYLYIGGPLLACVAVVAISGFAPLVLPATAVRTLMWSENLWLYGGILVFSAATLYDVQKILHHARLAERGLIKRDAVNESISLELDFLNIFIRMVQIMGMRNNNRR